MTTPSWVEVITVIWALDSTWEHLSWEQEVTVTIVVSGLEVGQYVVYEVTISSSVTVTTVTWAVVSTSVHWSSEHEVIVTIVVVSSVRIVVAVLIPLDDSVEVNDEISDSLDVTSASIV